MAYKSLRSSVDYPALDDAAAAALWPIRSKAQEEIGLLYQGQNGIERTPTQGGGRTRNAGGTFKVPPGSVRGIFHNHSPREIGRGARAREDEEVRSPSGDDVLQSRSLGVPSYISAGDYLFRYDPTTGKTEEVLSQIPLEEIRRLYLSEALKK